MKRGTIIRLALHAILAVLVSIPLMRLGSTQFDLSRSKLKAIAMGQALRELPGQPDPTGDDPYLRAQFRSQVNELRRERTHGGTLLGLSLVPFAMFSLLVWQALAESRTRRQSNNGLRDVPS